VGKNQINFGVEIITFKKKRRPTFRIFYRPVSKLSSIELG